MRRRMRTRTVQGTAVIPLDLHEKEKKKEKKKKISSLFVIM